MEPLSPLGGVITLWMQWELRHREVKAFSCKMASKISFCTPSLRCVGLDCSEGLNVHLESMADGAQQISPEGTDF